MVLHCSHPGGREIDGKVKGKASLRLADGMTISQPNSDEYRPQIVTLNGGYLVLAFGSNRACGGCTPGNHNIFLAKSLTPYNGTELPFFAPPVVLIDDYNDSPINDSNPINFAVVASGTNVKVYLNYVYNSYYLFTGTPDLISGSGTYSQIVNANYAGYKVIGASAAGNRLVVLNTQGTAHIIEPDNSQDPGSPYGFGLDNANSAMQVRQEVSGFDDAYIATIYGWSLATTGASPLGPILPFDLSVLGSGLQLTSIGAFYSNNPLGDLVLFSANDGQSDDMYIVTSHTAGELWGLTTVFSE
jgi:hypothetical protein